MHALDEAWLAGWLDWLCGLVWLKSEKKTGTQSGEQQKECCPCLSFFSLNEQEVKQQQPHWQSACLCPGELWLDGAEQQEYYVTLHGLRCLCEWIDLISLQVVLCGPLSVDRQFPLNANQWWWWLWIIPSRQTENIQWTVDDLLNVFSATIISCVFGHQTHHH